MSEALKRRWFAFSLRTMFIMVTMLCIAVAWLTYQLHWIRERHAAMSSLRGRQILTFDNGSSYRNGKESFTTFWVRVKRKPAPWSLHIFGEWGAGYLILDLPETDPELAHIRKLFPEGSISGRRD
jgi:hypothetical protein